MSEITVNDKKFKSKEDAIKYIEDLNEILVVKIFAYPDLNEGTHGPLLKDEYHFKAYEEIGNYKVKKATEPIIAELRNTLIKIYGAEYDYVMGCEANPIKLWDVKANFEISDEKNLNNINIGVLVENVKESFKDKLY